MGKDSILEEQVDDIMEENVQQSGAERRRFRRIDQQLEVRYYIAANSEPIRVYTEDISVGGIRIHNPFPIDERYKFPIRVVLEPGSNLEVKAIAQVAWQKKKPEAQLWEMGIEFIQMSDSDREAVENFLEAAG